MVGSSVLECLYLSLLCIVMGGAAKTVLRFDSNTLFELPSTDGSDWFNEMVVALAKFGACFIWKEIDGSSIVLSLFEC